MENKTVEKVKIESPVNHSNIYAALSNFQGELKPMAKNGKVQFETNTGKKVDFAYTPLGDIMETIYPLLKKHGLSIRHELSDKGIEAILTHETYEKIHMNKDTVTKGDGIQTQYCDYSEVIKNEIRSGILKISYGAQMKDTGANITYARRYTLTMVLGISSEDDKDAELLEQSAKNAIQTVYTRFKAGIEKATTTEEVNKQMIVIKKGIKDLESGKPGSLGLSIDQYHELADMGQDKIDNFDSNQQIKSDDF